MITSTSVDDFTAICGAAQGRAVAATHQRCLAVKAQSAGHGMLNSSRTVQLVDKAAADTFAEFASELFDALRTLNDAEPTADAASRRDQLQNLLEAQLRELGEAIRSALDQHQQMAQGLPNPHMIAATQLQTAIDRAVSEYRGHIGLAITALSNNTRPSPAVVHQPVFHAPVGNYQAGDRNTATVTQAAVSHVAPGEVQVALDALIQALQSAQSVPTDDRVAVVDMLERLKKEAASNKPNKRIVSTLIAGSRDVAELLAATPGAWETVKNWATFIGTNAVLAAPAVKQALQNLGG